MAERAVVLLSGGLDSATCLAMARAQGLDCYALSFRYGQRSQQEVVFAQRIAQTLGVVEHKVIDLDLTQIGGSSLTDHSMVVPESASTGVPSTYVPARNTIFLSIALGWAEVLGARRIVTGVNAVDYSGYPDCRPDYIAAFEHMANLATRSGTEGQPLHIDTPLIHLSKAQIIAQGRALKLNYAITVSCYQADTEGRACGRCDACRLRRDGFQAAGIADPTLYVGV